MIAQQAAEATSLWLTAGLPAILSAMAVLVSVAAVRQARKQWIEARRPDVIAWFGYTAAPERRLNPDGSERPTSLAIELVVENVGSQLATNVVLDFEGSLAGGDRFQHRYADILAELANHRGFTLAPRQRLIYTALPAVGASEPSDMPSGSITAMFGDSSGRVYCNKIALDLRVLGYARPRP